MDSYERESNFWLLMSEMRDSLFFKKDKEFEIPAKEMIKATNLFTFIPLATWLVLE